VIVIFGSEIWSLRWLAAIGALIFLGSLIGWHWPSRVPSNAADEQAFAREHNVLVRSSGSRTVARNGMMLTLLVFGVVLADLLLSYFYIRLENLVWPPPEIGNPEWILPAIGLSLWLLSLVPSRMGVRATHEDRQPALRRHLLFSFLLAAVGTGLIAYVLLTKNYSVSDHAYASLFVIIEGFLVLLMLGGLGMNLFVQFFARRGEYSSDCYIAVENTALYFTVTAVFGAIILAVLYGIPYLT
jgi:heme/copper-type cytochrome/quinol oxidase subunit 3